MQASDGERSLSSARESETKASAVVSKKKRNTRRRLGSKSGWRKRNENIGG